MLRAGFIGMGRMGKLMASRLEGHCVVSGTDVIPSVKDGVEAAGIAWCDSIQELTRCSDVIFVVVGSEDDVTSVVFDAEGVLASADNQTVIHAGLIRTNFARVIDSFAGLSARSW